MTTGILVLVIALLLLINIVLWKSGFLFQAEHPKTVKDIPVNDPKERRAFLKRLHRWREEGKISRDDHERFSVLSDEDWDEPQNIQPS